MQSSIHYEEYYKHRETLSEKEKSIFKSKVYASEDCSN